MSAIFLSHSSQDDALAGSLESWLKANGFDDIFIDHDSIRSGDNWADALRRAKGSCRVVMCLVTQAWLMSDECYGEFLAGWYAGRQVIPLLAHDAKTQGVKQKERLRRLLSESQGVDVHKAIGPDGFDLDPHPDITEPLKAGLRAAGALVKLGLDPYAFEVDRGVCPDPFPGLRSFGDTDADAAIFFGRSADIARCLEDLREMRATGDRRAYAILGASGSGKSSLLKAGVLPRLRREHAWVVLRCFRPGNDPLLNFSDAIARTAGELGLEMAPGAIRDRLLAAWTQGADLAQVLDSAVAPLKAGIGRPYATVLIAFDQGEELARADGDSGEVLAAYLKAALKQTSEEVATPYAVAFTVRSDSLFELEGSDRFRGLEARQQLVRMLPRYTFDTAIEQPAGRYGVEFEPALVEALMDDIGNEDALPILAFALQRLWHQYEKEMRIRREHYESIGKLSGLIEDAAERALRGLDPLSAQETIEDKVSEARDKHASHLFLPALAQVNERGVAVRRVARISDFDDEGKQLIGTFDKWRLIMKAGDGVEVAHEAMFREWPRFRRWLIPEKARLETLRGVESAADTWDAKGRRPDGLIHRGRSLAAALALDKVADYKMQLDRKAEVRAYLGSCRKAQRKRRLFAGAVFVAALLAPIAAMQVRDAIRALERRQAAEAAANYRPVSRILTKGETAGSLSVGTVFRDCPHCPEMVVLPAGKFVMGSPTDEKFREKDEGPQQTVSVPGFAMGKFDVTFDEWQICVAGGGCEENKKPDDRGWGRGRRPVISVTWADAVDYVHWLSELTGESYRLPSESEWEYAARAGTTTPFWTGDALGSDQANFNTGPQRTYPVGSYAPNRFGLYDMVGNVWQWVEDCYTADYSNVPTDGASLTSKNCLERSLRGGSWIDLPRYLRSAQRYKLLYSASGDSMGFRVARSIESTH